jgi:hypothetical protein
MGCLDPLEAKQRAGNKKAPIRRLAFLGLKAQYYLLHNILWKPHFVKAKSGVNLLHRGARFALLADRAAEPSGGHGVPCPLRAMRREWSLFVGGDGVAGGHGEVEG